MSVAKSTDVLIMGQSYRLSIPDGEGDDLMRAVQMVNDAMCKIRDAGKIKARDRIAVLAALNLAFENLPDLEESTVLSPEQEALADQASQQRLDNLIERLDEVLSEDGQLF